jgi:putative ABC transport system permease protein
MAEEMRLHLEHLTNKGVENGMTLAEASQVALRRFGGVDKVKEACRDQLGWRILDEIRRDMRFGLRVLGKNKGFTTVAVLTLALCIGANTAIFSMVYGLLLKPLPYPEPERLVEIYNNYSDSNLDLGKLPSGFGQYTDYKTQTTSYVDVGLWHFTTAMFGEGDAVEKIGAARCTAEMFDILGLKPVIGQFFSLKNSRWGEYKVIVLTQSFWETRYHSDPGVLDKAVKVDGEMYHIIGVAPRNLEAFDARVRFIKPLAWLPDWAAPKYRFYLNDSLYGRLKPNISVGSALAEAEILEKRVIDAEEPGIREAQTKAGHRIGVDLVTSERAEPIKTSLYLLQSGVVLVLLIGCVNIANLLLTRANGRQGELAIRTALGASRGAISRQLFAESLILTVCGSIFGAGMAWGGIHVMNHFDARLLPDMLPIAIDRGVLLFASALAVSVTLLIGILPVLHVLRTSLVEQMHGTLRGASKSRSVRNLSGILVTGQVAIALILLIGAGLLIHSFAKVLAVNPGFDPHRIVTAKVSIPWSIAGDAARSKTFQQQLMQSLVAIPDVEDVAFENGEPFEPGLPVNLGKIYDGTAGADAPQPSAYQVRVSVGYFQAMGIQLVDGRFLEERDTARVWRAVVVDERFAKMYFPGRSAVGGHIGFSGNPEKPEDWPVIVGVVRNVAHNGLENRGDKSFVYWPILPAQPGVITVLIRSQRTTGDLAPLIREKLRSIDPTVPMFDVDTLEHAIDASFDSRKAVMLLLGCYAALALFLSALGIYGVLAYDVSQRTREIGVRGAIGASRRQIVGMVMRQGLWKVMIGLCIGLVCAFSLSHLMASLLFELKPSDPLAYISVSLTLIAVAAMASYLPARNAAKIDPIKALRME